MEISKSHYGLTATTILNVNGQDWRILSMKRYSGQLVTTAQACRIKKGNGYTSFEYVPGQDESFTLLSEQVRVTEKAIKAHHEKALIIFNERGQQ
jgi:hypothetical protein